MGIKFLIETVLSIICLVRIWCISIEFLFGFGLALFILLYTQHPMPVKIPRTISDPMAAIRAMNQTVA